MVCVIHFWEQLCDVHGGECLLDSRVWDLHCSQCHMNRMGKRGWVWADSAAGAVGAEDAPSLVLLGAGAAGWYRWLRDDTEAPSENCPGVQAAPSVLPITRLADTATSGSCSKYQRFLTKSRLWRIQTIHNLFFCCAKICGLRTRVSLVAGVLNMSVPPTAFPRLRGAERFTYPPIFLVWRWCFSAAVLWNLGGTLLSLCATQRQVGCLVSSAVEQPRPWRPRLCCYLPLSLQVF